MDTAPDTAPTPAPAPDGADAPPASPENPPAPPGSEETPPWGDDFDPARAWKTIQSLRDVERAYKAEKAEQERAAREAADAEKTEAERLSGRIADLEAEIAKRDREALVASIAAEANVPETLREFLTAADEEGLRAQAERLAVVAAPPPAAPLPGKPKPRLVPGSAVEDHGDPLDPVEVAKRIRARS
jgi:hypothetical protein